MIDAGSPFAFGLLIHVEPVGEHWRARVWRDRAQVVEIVDTSAGAVLLQLGQALAGLMGRDAFDVATSAMQAELAAQAGIGQCPRCGQWGPIGIAPCPCTFGPGPEVH